MKYGGVNRFKRFYKNRHAVLRAEITDIKKSAGLSRHSHVNIRWRVSPYLVGVVIRHPVTA